MKILTNKSIKQFFLAICIVISAFFVISQFIIWSTYQTVAPLLLIFCLLAGGSILAICFCYFYKQNKIIEDAAEQLPEIKEFASLSEKELDRIETLVQSLLKITKLDAGSIIIQKACENVADMINEIDLSFAYRAKQEQKEVILSGADNITLFCDHDWMIEAISNVVKNALDHTNPKGKVVIEWKQLAVMLQITIKDDGNGIHPEDIHHIFKRFYRSRFSQDKQGIGLGLPLAKAIIETHDGTITADSILGQGSTFTINFLNPTKM